MGNGDTGTYEARTPLGVPSLDQYLDGGVRPGTSVLAIGSFGAGYRELLQTAAIMHGNWKADTSLFHSEYGDYAETIRQPERIQYVSFNETTAQLKRTFTDIAHDEWVDEALEAISFAGFGDVISSLGSVTPTSDGTLAYQEGAGELMRDYQEFLREFGDWLFSELTRDVVIIDSFSDLIPVAYKYMDWTDLYFILQTVCSLIRDSDSILIAGADTGLLDEREQTFFKRTFGNVLEFEWIEGESQQKRGMTISNFPQLCCGAAIRNNQLFEVALDRESFGISELERSSCKSA